MVNVTVTTGGTSGPRGSSILSGIGAPSNSFGFDGDFYLNLSNLNQIYGPKAAGIWPAPVNFGGAKSNLTATRNPLPSDDSTQSWQDGSVWVNTVTDVYFVASDVDPGTAIWTPVLPVGTVAGTVAAGNDSRITGAIQTGTAAGGDLSGALPNPQVIATHLAAPLPVIQGGTGSTTQNFVDLTTNQSVSGAKTFTDRILVPSPISTNDAVNLGFVQGLSAGLQIKANVAAISTAALPSNTYANGVSGVGATLTATAPGVLVVDSYTVLLNDRLIIKDEAVTTHNGFYQVTTLGTGGVPFVLTRTTDADTGAELAGAGTLAVNGTVNKGSGWVVISTPPITVGTDAITFTQFSSPGFINVGLGLRQVGNTISLETPVDPSNLPTATSSTYGVVQLNTDLGGTATNPTVVATHLASALPVLQGGTGSTTASGARTNLGLGTSATANIDTNPVDIKALGSQAAGASGQVADASHVHPTTGVTLHTEAGTTVVPETAYNQSTVVGTAVTYAREDHSHGSPALTNTAPATTEGIATAAAVGVATTPARADHVHPMAGSGTPTTSAVGDTAAAGNASTFAASNHTHGRESFGAATSQTTYGLTSAAGTATTISHSDHTHGSPSLTTSAPAVTEAIGTAAALGTATTPALADHVHPMASAGTPTNSAVTDVAATGAATTFASSNHVHGREGFGVVTPLTTFGAASATGTATTVSHSDHAHGSPALPDATPSVKGVLQLTGDLDGTATAPTVAKVNGVSITGTPVYGASPVATTATASSWAILPHFASSGLYTGGVMTQNGSILNAFDITAASGYVVDYHTTPSAPAIAPVSISAQTVTLSGAQTSQVVNYWYANSSGTILSQTTPLTGLQRRANILLGQTWSATGTGNLYNIMSAPIVLPYNTDTLWGVFLNLGGFSASGNVVTPNGANLNINKSAGTQLAMGYNYASGGSQIPNLVTNPAETVATFRYVTRNTSTQSATRTTIDVANWDNAGTITALAANANAAIHRVWMIPTGVAGSQIVIQYGQVQYSSLATANSAIGQEAFVENPDVIGSQGVLIGYITAVKNATTLNNTAQSVFFMVGRFPNA